MKATFAMLAVSLLVFPGGRASADQAGRKHAENELHALPAVRVTVGLRDADIIGSDNRALQAAVDYVGNLGGGVVEVGPGEFLMRDSLHLRSRVTVRGAGERTVLKKDREHRSALAADGDFGEAAITVKETNGFAIGGGVYVASKSQRNFHGVCATVLNGRGNYFTLTRAMNADIMVSDGGFAATAFPVISGYNLQEARVESLSVDGNRSENPTKVDGCRTAGIFLYRGDNCVISNCVVRDYNGDGISFQQSNDVKVDRCIVERCAGFGLHPGSGSQRPSVTNCRAVGNGDDGFFFCWRVRGGVAEGNWLEDNGGYGMSIGHKDSDNFVRRNTIVRNKRGGVYWRAEAEAMAAHRVTFEHNIIRDNEGWGLFVDGATDGTIIRHNTIEDSGDGRQKTGIRVGRQAGRVTLEQNTVKAARDVQDDRARLPAEIEASRAEPRFWLENMLVHHRYTWDEAATVLGWSVEETKAKAAALDISPESKPSANMGGKVRALPYPGGRHPRIGFLDGAIDPQRGTKVSLLPPWKDGGYVVLDLPEAIFSNLGLTYLAHTHIPTIWSSQGVTITNVDWTRGADGSLRSEWRLPNGIAFGAVVTPIADGADCELWLRNGTKSKLTEMRTQVCLMLKGAPGFTEQSQAGKEYAKPLAVATASGARRHVLLAFERCGRAWGNPPCPCIHSDPVLPDAAPGERVSVRGKLRFYEGADLDGAKKRLLAELEGSEK